ncbi:MAG: leucyl/phenylalanyl-tRNA--protein transferase [Desulfuromonadales bacterium]|nr:leucyl/phenylalanyl-tRNA--protein transferase [Desulfuromonadales bacterium]
MPLFRLTDELIFPPATLAEADGLLAIGGDLTLPRLLLAYSSGLFPWSNEGEPPLWWSPDPRCIFEPGEMRVSRSLAKTLRQGRYRVSYNQEFEQVIGNCAKLRIKDGTGTWINGELYRSFLELHRGGYAHSIECWHGDLLAGGVYGLCLGRCFFGESMFHVEKDASKVALFALLQRSALLGFELVDCQLANSHLLSLGAVRIARIDFLQRLIKGGVLPSSRPAPGSIALKA